VGVPTQPDAAFEGAIKRVPSDNAPLRDRLVRIALKGASNLDIGTRANVIALVGRRENALWVPPSVVRTYRGRQFVVVQDSDGSQRRVDVKLGLQANDRVEILDGLREGDMVVAP
jgi:multidrug efflux pump subunit AcrA (membrane-fusion protein)